MQDFFYLQSPLFGLEIAQNGLTLSTFAPACHKMRSGTQFDQ